MAGGCARVATIANNSFHAHAGCPGLVPKVVSRAPIRETAASVQGHGVDGMIVAAVGAGCCVAPQIPLGILFQDGPRPETALMLRQVTCAMSPGLVYLLVNYELAQAFCHGMVLGPARPCTCSAVFYGMRSGACYWSGGSERFLPGGHGGGDSLDAERAGMLAVILVGAARTRLAALHPGIPKALAPVAGRPFLQWQLSGCCAAGETGAPCLRAPARSRLPAGAGARHGTVVLGRAVSSPNRRRTLRPGRRKGTFFAINGGNILPNLRFQAWLSRWKTATPTPPWRSPACEPAARSGGDRADGRIGAFRERPAAACWVSTGVPAQAQRAYGRSRKPAGLARNRCLSRACRGGPPGGLPGVAAHAGHGHSRRNCRNVRISFKIPGAFG